MLEAAEDGQCDGRGGCGFADGVGEKKIKKRAAGPTQGRAEKKEDQDMGVIASGCRIAWHMGPFGGVSGYCTGRTVPRRTVCTRTRAAATPRRHDTQLRFFAQQEEGGGRETTPPQAVTLLSPFGPEGSLRTQTAQANPGQAPTEVQDRPSAQLFLQRLAGRQPDRSRQRRQWQAGCGSGTLPCHDCGTGYPQSRRTGDETDPTEHTW